MTFFSSVICTYQVNKEEKKKQILVSFGQLSSSSFDRKQKTTMSVLLMKKSKPRTMSRSSSSLPSMTVIGSAQPDVIKVKVYKPNRNQQGEQKSGSSKKFCIDPRITTYRTMQYLISQSFDLKSDFTINAIQTCPVTGQERSTIIWSDWDLDTAIKNVKPGSYLRLRYELAPSEEGLGDWDFVSLNDVSANIRWFNVDSRSIIATANQTKSKTPSTLNKAINWMYGGNERRTAKPVGGNEMKKFFDSDGRLIRVNELRQAIYEGGVDPSCRKVIWRYLLNIFPSDMTSFERIEYANEVTINYEKLKKRWQIETNRTEKQQLLMCTIRKDVLRTDRKSGFYASAGDNNVNLEYLFNILTTYCFSHPTVTYCQGMNEYASTLLYVMRDEALAYLGFCSIMRRLRANFSTDGVAIATKFHHLKVLLQAIDPVFWNFLESCDAVNLYFTYRWLLLECKREFPFNDTLRVLEVMWATLPIDSEPPAMSEFSLLSEPSSPTRIVAIIRSSIHPPIHRRALSCPQFSPPDQYNLVVNHRQHSSSVTCHNREQFLANSQQENNISFEYEEYQFPSSHQPNQRSTSNSTRSKEKSLENSFSLSEIADFDSDQLSIGTSETSKMTSDPLHHLSATTWLQRLPTGNTHRNYLLKQKNLDEQEIGMHFDRYIRRHSAEQLLSRARTLYGQYIQWARKKRMLDDLESFSAS